MDTADQLEVKVSYLLAAWFSLDGETELKKKFRSNLVSWKIKQQQKSDGRFENPKSCFLSVWLPDLERKKNNKKL